MAVLVFDSSCLCAFARAHRLEVLERCVQGSQCKVTRAVLDEIRRGVGSLPELDALLHLGWLETIQVDGLPELLVFADLSRRFSKTGRDVGEASVIAWVKVNGGVALLDDRAGRQAARELGVPLRGTLGLLAAACDSGLLLWPEAAATVDDLLAAGARLPCDGRRFQGWCSERGIP